MQLRITDSQKLIDVAFGKWLLKYVKLELVSNIKHQTLTNCDNYLNNLCQQLNIKTNVKSIDLLLLAADQLICDGVDGEVVIRVNNVCVSNFGNLKLLPLVKALNYGTLDLHGCFVFSKTFDKFAKNLDDFLDLYYSI